MGLAGAVVASGVLANKERKLRALETEFAQETYEYEDEKEKLLKKIKNGSRGAEKRLKELEREYSLAKMEYESKKRELFPHKPPKAEEAALDAPKEDGALTEVFAEENVAAPPTVSKEPKPRGYVRPGEVTAPSTETAPSQEENGTVCRRCGSKNPENAKFCNSCGNDLANVKYCSQCGEKAAAGSLFCSNCGEPLT